MENNHKQTTFDYLPDRQSIVSIIGEETTKAWEQLPLILTTTLQQHFNTNTYELITEQLILFYPEDKPSVQFTFKLKNKQTNKQVSFFIKEDSPHAYDIGDEGEEYFYTPRELYYVVDYILTSIHALEYSETDSNRFTPQQLTGLFQQHSKTILQKAVNRLIK